VKSVPGEVFGAKWAKCPQAHVKHNVGAIDPGVVESCQQIGREVKPRGRGGDRPRRGGVDGLIAFLILGVGAASADIGRKGGFAHFVGRQVPLKLKGDTVFRVKGGDPSGQTLAPPLEDEFKSFTEPAIGPNQSAITGLLLFGPKDQGLGGASGDLASAEPGTQHSSLVHDEQIAFAENLRQVSDPPGRFRINH